MATSSSQKNIFKNADVIVPIGVIAMVIMMIIPLPPGILDILLVLNISFSLIVLLVAMFNLEPLRFSVFPTLLLIMTLFRLALNVSSTRLILLYAHAGDVIKQFGLFVVGGNPVVGFIIFLILIVIQFIVITKGAERVAEVAARFTLDAMPGKQMAIDADLNAGLITEMEAKTRRQTIQREADFYGAMDGASKFVKGDAIAGIVITVINIIGGIIVGMLQKNMGSFGEVVSTYTLLTVGDGLVSQIPALLISTATGVIVTRATSLDTLGNDLSGQLLSNPKVLTIAAGVIISLGLVPGLPTLPFLLLGGSLTALAYTLNKLQKEIDIIEADKAELEEVEEIKKPESVYSLLQVDSLELELGYALIPLVDNQQGGDLLDRVVMIRRQCALELGVVIPPIRIRDNMQLAPNNYVLKVKGVPLAKGELFIDHYLVMSSDGDIAISGIDTKEPAFGLPAKWIPESNREEAEMYGYTVVDAPSVLATHLTEFIKNYISDIITRQDIKALIDNIKKEFPAVVDEVTPSLLSLSEIHKIISNLLSERIPIRNLVTILETLADYAPLTKDADLLTEYVRQSLANQIGQLYADDFNIVKVITIDPEVEEIVKNAIQVTEGGNYLALDPSRARQIIDVLAKVVEKATLAGNQPVVLTSPVIRPYFKKLAERVNLGLPVISYNEIPNHLEVEGVGMVRI